MTIGSNQSMGYLFLIRKEYNMRMNPKKLVFALLFLMVFALFSYELAFVLNIPNLALSFSFGTLVQLVVLTILAILASLFFVIFAALAFDWRLIGPVSLLGAILILVFLGSTIGIIAGIISFIILCSVYLLLEQKLKTYLDFRPSELFKPTIKNLAWFLIVISSISYYLMISQEISQKGFQIPDSLIDTTLKFMPAQSPEANLDTTANTNLPQITHEQIQELRKNPQLLKQYGLDTKMLDTIENQINSGTKSVTKAANLNPNSFIKDAVKAQLQAILKPYQKFIAPLLALLFYFSLTFFSSIFSIFISPLIWLIFLILRKVNFISFTEEQRTVKKMVV